MSQKSSTAEQNIALVAGNKIRKYGQIVIIFMLIGFTIGFVSWYSFAKADPAFLLYVATGLLAILFAGIGAAFANMGLGRTVGSVANNNGASMEEIVAIIAALKGNGPPTTPGPIAEIPDIENPLDDDLGDLDDERPAEVPPGRSD